ncbi:phage tail tube protein, partial [Halomonas sp. BBD48]|nr:phage tail tube protein [Halomonas sp. BBD48]
LLIGTADKSFSIEKQFTDEGKFLAFRGMRVGQMSLNFQYGQILTGSFNFAGNGSESVASSLVGAGTVAAATTSKVLNASTDIASISIDGSTASGIEIQSISLQLNNNLRAIEAIGHDAPVDQKKGTAAITGTIQAYLSAESFAWYQKSLDQADVALEFSVTDGTDTYTFTLPRIHLTVQAPQSGGLDQDVMISADYTALYDSVAGTSLKLVRS